MGLIRDLESDSGLLKLLVLKLLVPTWYVRKQPAYFHMPQYVWILTVAHFMKNMRSSDQRHLMSAKYCY